MKIQCKPKDTVGRMSVETSSHNYCPLTRIIAFRIFLFSILFGFLNADEVVNAWTSNAAPTWLCAANNSCPFSTFILIPGYRYSSSLLCSWGRLVEPMGRRGLGIPALTAAAWIKLPAVRPRPHDQPSLPYRGHPGCPVGHRYLRSDWG